jgi:hypothetical protein
MRTTMVSLQTHWRRRWEYDGNPKNLIIGALSSLAFTLGLDVLENLKIWEAGFGPPMVLLVGFVASRLGLRAGLVCALAGMISMEFLLYDASFRFMPTSTIKVSIYGCSFAAALLFARVAAPTANRVFDRGPDLPFTRRSNGPDEKGNGGGLHGNGWIYWDARASGKWPEDIQVGAEYARIWAERAMSGESYPRLPWIIYDMIKSGRWSGVEASFASALERMALRRPAPPAEPPQQSQD